MKRQFEVVDECGIERKIVGITDEEWTDLTQPCPHCEGREFNHVTTGGGHYGPRGSATVERADFWTATRPLYTQCRICRTVLYKHPAFDLLFARDRSEDRSSNCKSPF